MECLFNMNGSFHAVLYMVIKNIGELQKMIQRYYNIQRNPEIMAQIFHKRFASCTADTKLP